MSFPNCTIHERPQLPVCGLNEAPPHGQQEDASSVSWLSVSSFVGAGLGAFYGGLRGYQNLRAAHDGESPLAYAQSVAPDLLGSVKRGAFGGFMLGAVPAFGYVTQQVVEMVAPIAVVGWGAYQIAQIPKLVTEGAQHLTKGVKYIVAQAMVADAERENAAEADALNQASDEEAPRPASNIKRLRREWRAIAQSMLDGDKNVKPEFLRHLQEFNRVNALLSRFSSKSESTISKDQLSEVYEEAKVAVAQFKQTTDIVVDRTPQAKPADEPQAQISATALADPRSQLNAKLQEATTQLVALDLVDSSRQLAVKLRAEVTAFEQEINESYKPELDVDRTDFESIKSSISRVIALIEKSIQNCCTDDEAPPTHGIRENPVTPTSSQDDLSLHDSIGLESSIVSLAPAPVKAKVVAQSDRASPNLLSVVEPDEERVDQDLGSQQEASLIVSDWNPFLSEADMATLPPKSSSARVRSSVPTTERVVASRSAIPKPVSASQILKPTIAVSMAQVNPADHSPVGLRAKAEFLKAFAENNEPKGNISAMLLIKAKNLCDLSNPITSEAVSALHPITSEAVSALHKEMLDALAMKRQELAKVSSQSAEQLDKVIDGLSNWSVDVSSDEAAAAMPDWMQTTKFNAL